LYLLGFRPAKSTLALLCLFALFSADMISPLIYGNPVSFSGLFILLSLFFVKKEKDQLAGVFLALATFKPQTTLLVFLLVWLWSFSKKRWKIITWSAGTVIVLLGVSFLMQPDWVSGFLRQMFAYPQFASPNTPRSVLSQFDPLLGRWASIGLSLFCGFILLIEWKKMYKQGFIDLFWTACLTLSILPLSGIASTKSNFVLLLPAVILLVQLSGYGKHRKVIWMNMTIIILMVLGWWLKLLSHQWTYEIPGQSYVNLDLLPLPILLITALLVFRRTFFSNYQSVEIEEK
jgi:hypothetical protein